jgi:hypothetical protein
MAILTISHKGSFKKTNTFLDKLRDKNIYKSLDKYGQEGVVALSSATPVDTGLTASSWSYEIVKTSRAISLVWKNSNVVDGVPIAIIIQYGHVTATGGWVEGIDYINPSLKPIFDKILKNVWKEVTD